MKQKVPNIKILHLEDRQSDAELVAMLLRKANISAEIKVVDNGNTYEEALKNFGPDIIVSDHNLPQFDSMKAITLLKRSGLKIPFILVTGTVSEEFAVEAMRTGADDYILKDRMQRLPGAILSALEKFRFEKDQKEAETKTHQSEVKYRSFFENSMDGILLTVTDGEILAANPAACAMFQMSEKEIVAAGRFGLVDRSDPRLRKLIEERQYAGKAKGEITLQRKDGSKFPGELTSSTFVDAYGQRRTCMMVRDITDRKEGEQKLAAANAALEKALNDLEKIMNSSMDMICAIDEQNRFKQVSAASETILGYKPDELIGKPITDFIYRQDKEKTKEAVIGVMAGHSMTNFENRYVRKDGSVVPLVWSASWDSADKTRYSVARDATEKKRIEKSIADERQKSEYEMLSLIDSLKAKNNDLQQFSYIVSHNLRAPIAKILGLVNIMGPSPEENDELIKMIAVETTNLDEVVKDINTIVSARQSEKEKRENVNFESMLNQIMHVFESEIAKSEAIISWNFSLAPNIETVKSYLYSVMYNLISNAIKYRMPAIPLRIHVETTLVDRFISLSIKDNGRGLDLETFGTKIFGLYKRFHEADIPGKGVGLNMVKTHSESLGGRVEVESKVNEGATFKVYLPANYGTNNKQ